MVHNKNNTILKMIKGEETSHTPIFLVYATSWPFATRISKIERKIFALDITRQPELCAYVTHLPVECRFVR